MKTLIKNCKIITPYDVLYGYGVIVEDDKINNILEEENIDTKEFYNIIDGEGGYLAPGFIDIHNHGNSGFDIMDRTEEALDKIGEYHISNGVTSYLGTVITSSYEDMENAIKNIVEYKNKEDKSNIIGIHLEGPFFNIIKKGAQPEKHIKVPDRQEMEKILEISKGLLKMVSLAPELEGALGLIRYIKANNVTVAMAHTNSTYDEAKKGINNGITVATHLYNGMRGFNHREPGVIGASLLDDRVYCELIYDRFHLHDGAVKIALRSKGYDKIVLVSDAMMAAGLKDGEYVLGGQRVNVYDGKPRLESGSIAGSTLDLQRAVYNMVNYLQVPINEAVKMASLNPAKAINMDKELGSIEIGKIADFIIFNEDIEIQRVFLGGNLAWKKN
ncbi:N-acetylglucosamine-6-phosphate deacetylase [Wansuia hejianensis]|uniref:N-acetylglucosamine-6-phosphate deacetylase n=1 Tax=Wansuia hejianensis TaxID=2763667 RepID=A0A926EZP2_9FIRM|nr:N-acetylglucosamine-6-phosphate deacetylase [Wansuia hejianensis]MBC8591338.1 N-acetylglucosamine-6-phosphate deacetylase [Wansuia hejianensis]